MVWSALLIPAAIYVPIGTSSSSTNPVGNEMTNTRVPLVEINGHGILVLVALPLLFSLLASLCLNMHSTTRRSWTLGMAYVFAGLVLAGPSRQRCGPGGRQRPLRPSRSGPRSLDHLRLLQQRPRTAHDLARQPRRYRSTTMRHRGWSLSWLYGRTPGLPKRCSVQRQLSQRQLGHRLGDDPLHPHPSRWIEEIATCPDVPGAATGARCDTRSHDTSGLVGRRVDR